jgi:hypothetical protein
LEKILEGNSCLLSSGAPDSPVRHRTTIVACPMRDFLPNQAQSTVAASGPLAHRTLSGAHRTVRCPLPTVGAAKRRPQISRPTVGSLDSPVHHRTVRWIIATSPFPFHESDEFTADDSPDSSVHHRTVRWIIAVHRRQLPRAAFSPETSLAHRILSGAPPNSPVCQSELKFGCSQPSLLQSNFSLFGTVSST